MSEMTASRTLRPAESEVLSADSDWLRDTVRQANRRTLNRRTLKIALYQLIQSTPPDRRTLADYRGRGVAAGGRTSQSAAAPRAYRAHCESADCESAALQRVWTERRTH